jgi:hypothetical protein
MLQEFLGGNLGKRGETMTLLTASIVVALI